MGLKLALVVVCLLLVGGALVWLMRPRGKDPFSRYGYRREELEKIILEADRGSLAAQGELQKLFRRGFTAREHDAVRARIYLPLAEEGDPAAKEWLEKLGLEKPENQN